MICKPLRTDALLLAIVASLAEVMLAQTDLQQRLQPSAFRGRTAVASTASRGSALGTVPPDFDKLKLAPGFLLNLNVLDDSDFTGFFRVDEQGNIAVPVLGAIHVAGQTATEARLQIRQKLLDEKLLNDPQVDLAVVEYTPPEVTIVGEVNSPGKFPLLVPHKLVDVLSLAGGPSQLAGNEVEIASGEPGAQPQLVRYSRTSNPKDVENVIVHPGDTVLVERAGIVYVLGSVTRPGGFVMQEEGSLNLLQAVSLAGGTSPTASTGSVILLRRNSDGSVQRLTLPYRKIAHGKASDVPLRPTDVVYVPTSAIKSAFVDTQQIMMAAATSSVYLAMGY